MDHAISLGKLFYSTNRCRGSIFKAPCCHDANMCNVYATCLFKLYFASVIAQVRKCTKQLVHPNPSITNIYNCQSIVLKSGATFLTNPTVHAYTYYLPTHMFDTSQNICCLRIDPS